MLRTYAIYDHPTDFPAHWVVRGWEVIRGLRLPQPDAQSIICASLEEAREVVQRLDPLAQLLTTKQLDPCIAEEWG